MAKPFWRNVILIALAHIALIAVLIRWSLAARAPSNPESIIWLGTAGELTAAESPNEPSPRSEGATAPEQETLKEREAEKERPLVTAKSEIELPSPTPAVTSSPKPQATPAPKSKSTTKRVSKATDKKTLLTKASPKPSPKSLNKRRSSLSAVASAKAEDHHGDEAKRKTTPASQGSGKTVSADKIGGIAGGSSASEFGWYGNMLHDRFYRAWIQPTSNVPAGGKISALVRVRIEKDGRISKFKIIKPSENVAVNESVRVVAKQVTQVDAPPTGLIKDDHYDVKINFELNTNQETGNQ